MSVSFMWEIMKPERARCFSSGTSSDSAALKETFGSTISSDSIGVLNAMHRATWLDKLLWSEIAETLERLRGDDFDKTVTIKVWEEY